MAGTDNDSSGAHHSDQFDYNVGRVGHNVEDRRSLLRLRQQRLEVLLRGVGVDGEAGGDAIEPVAYVRVGTQDAATTDNARAC